MLGCPPFYKPGTLANGRAGCVPTWDITGGNDNIPASPSAPGAPDSPQAQAELEREADAAQARMEAARDAYLGAAKGTEYARSGAPVPMDLQRFIIYGVGLILLVIAFNRLMGGQK